MMLSEPVSSGVQFFNLVPWVVFLPAIGVLINVIFGGRLLNSGPNGEKIVGGIASGMVGLAFVVALLQFVSLSGSS